MLGVYPKPILSTIDRSVEKMLILMEQKAVLDNTREVIINANTVGERD